LLADLASRGFFFFSSRRRHTRFDCDWSSDVCSSDLSRYALHASTSVGSGVRLAGGRHLSTFAMYTFLSRARPMAASMESSRRPRSEERRVGKEGRSRGWPHQYKQEQDTRGEIAADRE